MYIYRKAQFQTFQHKLIKYTDTWGAAFSSGYLIKIRQTNKQTNWKAVIKIGTENNSHLHSLIGATRLNELFL